MRKFDNTVYFDASKFTWDLGTGVAECSSLGLKPGREPFCQVYNDACDAGMTLLNHGRGTRCDFVLDDTIHGADMGVVKWEFVSVETPERLQGAFAVTIFND